MEKNLWYLLTILGLAMIYITAAIHVPSTLNKVQIQLEKGILTMLLVPTVGMLLNQKGIKKFVKCFVIVWTIVFTIYSILGIYAVSKGIKIYSLTKERFIGLYTNNALFLLDGHQNRTGAHLVVSMMVAVIGMSIFDNKLIKGCLAASLFPFYICLVMTGSRTAQGSVSFGAGVILAFSILSKWNKIRDKKVLRVFVSVLIIIAVTVAGVFIVKASQPLVNKALSGEWEFGIEAHALAETETAQENPEIRIRERGFLDDNIFTGRDIAWKAAILAIRDKPSILITGTSLGSIMWDVRKLSGMQDIVHHSHLHSLLLQTLVSLGLGGFFLLIAFLFIVLKSAWKLLFGPCFQVWERWLTLPVLCLLLIDTIECLTWMGLGLSRSNLANVVTLFSGFIIATARRSRDSELYIVVFTLARQTILPKKWLMIRICDSKRNHLPFLSVVSIQSHGIEKTDCHVGV